MDTSHQSVTPGTKVFYKVDSPYAPQAEGGIRYDDPNLAIDWPTHSPILSDKDKALPLLKDLGFRR